MKFYLGAEIMPLWNQIQTPDGRREALAALEELNAQEQIHDPHHLRELDINRRGIVWHLSERIRQCPLHDLDQIQQLAQIENLVRACLKNDVSAVTKGWLELDEGKAQEQLKHRHQVVPTDSAPAFDPHAVTQSWALSLSNARLEKRQQDFVEHYRAALSSAQPTAVFTSDLLQHALTRATQGFDGSVHEATSRIVDNLRASGRVYEHCRRPSDTTTEKRVAGAEALERMAESLRQLKPEESLCWLVPTKGHVSGARVTKARDRRMQVEISAGTESPPRVEFTLHAALGKPQLMESLSSLYRHLNKADSHDFSAFQNFADSVKSPGSAVASYDLEGRGISQGSNPNCWAINIPVSLTQTLACNHAHGEKFVIDRFLPNIFARARDALGGALTPNVHAGLHALEHKLATQSSAQTMVRRASAVPQPGAPGVPLSPGPGPARRRGIITSSPGGPTDLHNAAKSNDAERIVKLVRGGADVNARDPRSGETAAHVAVQCGNANAIEALIKANANFYLPCNEGRCASHLFQFHQLHLLPDRSSGPRSGAAASVSGPSR